VEPISATVGAAIALLAPYLAKAGEGFATSMGQKLAGKASALYGAVKNKFKGDPDAEEILARVEEQPESKTRRVALEGVLAQKIDEDPDFATTVRQLVEEAKAADQGNVIAWGERSVAATQIFGDVSTGDTNRAP
jgi:hypothetical protein